MNALESYLHALQNFSQKGPSALEFLVRRGEEMEEWQAKEVVFEIFREVEEQYDP